MTRSGSDCSSSRADDSRPRSPQVVLDREGYREITVGDAAVMTVLDEDARGVAQPRALVMLYARSLAECAS